VNRLYSGMKCKDRVYQFGHGPSLARRFCAYQSVASQVRALGIGYCIIQLVVERLWPLRRHIRWDACCFVFYAESVLSFDMGTLRSVGSAQ